MFESLRNVKTYYIQFEISIKFYLYNAIEQKTEHIIFTELKKNLSCKTKIAQ